MNRKILLTTFIAILIVCVEGRKTSSRSRSSGSGRGSSKKTNYNPAPTSFSYPQPSAPKPSLFGWQEKPAQKTQTLSSWQTKPSSGQGHSYPSSNTGLSGNKPKPLPNHQESIQRSSAPSNSANQQMHTGNQAGHSYPSSTGLSGSSGNGYRNQGTGLSGGSQTGSVHPQQHGSSLSGGGQPGSSYPQQHGSGLSGGGQPGSGYPLQTGGGYPNNQGSGSAGSAVAPPPYSGYRPGDVNHPYNGHNHQGNNYYHPQGPPPPYSSNYGGLGGHGPYNPGYGQQMPGYFGGYGSPGKGFGGVSRTGSTLKGVGIAGAGIGTVLTGLALWNLARSTGQRHHTVIYDNRGQPVAVAPANDTAPTLEDAILADLVNCTLSISNGNTTEVLAIPCAIATSFIPDADVKDSHINENTNDNTKCTVTVVKKSGKEYMTTIPCSILLNSAAENNVTEPPPALAETVNITNITNETPDLNTTVSLTNTSLNQPIALKYTDGDVDIAHAQLNCTPHSGEIRDPINPCYAVKHNLTVIPLPSHAPL